MSANGPRFGAIVQCRLDSTRLPGKMLLDVSGSPLLHYVLTRCGRVDGLAGLVVATSSRPVDDPIAQFCERNGHSVFRGSAEDVALRLLECALENKLDYFFRVNGDSPWLEPSLLEQAIGVARDGLYDIVTNLSPRSFPYGVSVELLRTEVYAQAYPKMQSPRQTENATQYYYDNFHEFQSHNISRDGQNLSGVRLTVDTLEDFERFQNELRLAEEGWRTLTYARLLNIAEDQR
ncbi:MAG: cytidylyltransferase domain-containing protein [Armatimonadota bacterium]